MNSIPAGGSYTVIDSESRVWHVTPNSQPLENVDHGGPIAGRDTVDISQAARDRYRTDINRGEATARPPGFEEMAKRQGAMPAPDQLASAYEQLAAIEGESLGALAEDLRARRTVLGKAIPEYEATHQRLEAAYTAFVKDFLGDHVQFERASFGFSVEADGKLVAKNTGVFSEGEIYHFERALNQSPELVALSGRLADLSIAIYEAEERQRPFKFNRDNFAQTIDIGAALLSKRDAREAPSDPSANDIHRKSWDNEWRQQLFHNGEARSRGMS